MGHSFYKSMHMRNSRNVTIKCKNISHCIKSLWESIIISQSLDWSSRIT
jgi:hypothetical protein